MFISMNRFKIIKGVEQRFEGLWVRRADPAIMHEIPGFVEFHLLRGREFDDHTQYVSHIVWESEKSMREYDLSEAFRKDHSVELDRENIYLEPPNCELFNPVRTVERRE